MTSILKNKTKCFGQASVWQENFIFNIPQECLFLCAVERTVKLYKCITMSLPYHQIRRAAGRSINWPALYTHFILPYSKSCNLNK